MDPEAYKKHNKPENGARPGVYKHPDNNEELFATSHPQADAFVRQGWVFSRELPTAQELREATKSEQTPAEPALTVDEVKAMREELKVEREARKAAEEAAAQAQREADEAKAEAGAAMQTAEEAEKRATEAAAKNGAPAAPSKPAAEVAQDKTNGKEANK